jgi:hypothetical protein
MLMLIPGAIRKESAKAREHQEGNAVLHSFVAPFRESLATSICSASNDGTVLNYAPSNRQTFEVAKLDRKCNKGG